MYRNSFGHNTYGAPYLNSYGDAKAWYDKIKPIRGTDIRPIGMRRYHPCASIEMDGDNVVLRFERNPFIVWEPDSSFTIHVPAHPYAQQANRMCGWAPHGMNFSWEDKRLFIRVAHTGHKLYLAPGSSMRFEVVAKRDDGKPLFDAVDDEPQFEYKFRRGVVNKLLKEHCGDFLSWATVILSVTKVDWEEASQGLQDFKRSLGYTEEFCKRFERELKTTGQENLFWAFNGNLNNRVPFQLTNEGLGSVYVPACDRILDMIRSSHDNWPAVLNLIASKEGRLNYVAHYIQGRSSYLTIKLEKLEKFLKRVVASAYRHEVFEVTAVERGSTVTARNSGFFTDVSLPNPKQTDSLSGSSI